MRYLSIVLVLVFAVCAHGADVRSYPPVRPLPEASAAPLPEGPLRWVDAAKGDDASAGTEDAPWKTIVHALTQLKPGDALVLRGGMYYEQPTVSLAGTAEKPITIRSAPGELATIHGGYRQFMEKPAECWRPFGGGAPGEYVSTGTYPDLAAGEGGRRGVRVAGNFADSMVPLHGYHTLIDLRSTNEFWTPEVRDSKTTGLYCGPGLWCDPETKRVHVRLAHTFLAGLLDRNYRGETDPRKLALVIGGAGNVLTLDGAKHLVLRDLVLCGTRGATLRIGKCEGLVLDGVTAFGGSPTVKMEYSKDVRIVNCAFRGVSAPWSFRSSEKYRGLSAYLFTGVGRLPLNTNVEMAWSEFSDSHDGLVIGQIDNLDFHHNRVDNFNDDGLYLTSGGRPGENVRIHHNLISRCLSAFSFAGSGKGQEGKIAYIYRNVFDLREPVHYFQPRGADEPQELLSPAKICGDHGSPIWKPMYFYQNTFILRGTTWRSYYGGQIGGRATRSTTRRLFNNIFFHTEGVPGMRFMPDWGDLAVDGNLHWSLTDGPKLAGTWLQSERTSQTARRQGWVEKSKELYAPGWTAHDVFADPLFTSVTSDWHKGIDVRITEKSPAIDAGVPIPADWPDPVRDADAGAPDIGAMPLGAEPWTVGIRGRIPVFVTPEPDTEEAHD